jgi:protein-S-isoprenylcysteine O-methyltransferase Ste14
MTDTGTKPTGIRVLPPLVFLAALILAFLAHWLWPGNLGLSAAIRLPLGILLIVLALAPMPSIFAAFRRMGSAYDVRKVPKGLVTGGAFAYSRNPGYMAMIVVCIGVAIVFNNPWVFLFLAPAVAIIRDWVVLREEKILEREFGDEYRAYKKRVRRWI